MVNNSKIVKENIKWTIRTIKQSFKIMFLMILMVQNNACTYKGTK